MASQNRERQFEDETNKIIIQLMNIYPNLEWNEAKVLLEKNGFDLLTTQTQLDATLNINLTMVNPGNLEMKSTN